MTDTREGKVWVGAKVAWMWGEAGNSFWVVHQRMGLYCCSVVQALTVRRCYTITPVDVLAVANRLWCGSVGMAVDLSRGDWGCRCNDLISWNVHSQPLNLWLLWKLNDQCPFQLLVVERPCFLLRTEPPREKVGITSLSLVVQYNEFPEGRWWVPCSRRLAGPRCRPCFFWAPRCSAIVC